LASGYAFFQASGFAFQATTRQDAMTRRPDKPSFYKNKIDRIP